MQNFRETRSSKETDLTNKARSASPSSNFNFLRMQAEILANQRLSEIPQGSINPCLLEVSSQGQTNDRVEEWRDKTSYSDFPDIETSSQATGTTRRSQKRSLERDQATISDGPHKKAKTEKMPIDEVKKILDNIERNIKGIINDYYSNNFSQQQKNDIAKDCKELYDQWKKFTQEFAAIIETQIVRKDLVLSRFDELKRNKRELEQTKKNIEQEEETPSMSGYDFTEILRNQKHSLQGNIDQLNTKLQGKDEATIVNRKIELQTLSVGRRNQEVILDAIYKNFLSLQESQSSSMEEASSASHLDSSQASVRHTDVPPSSYSTGKGRALEVTGRFTKEILEDHVKALIKELEADPDKRKNSGKTSIANLWKKDNGLTRDEVDTISTIATDFRESGMLDTLADLLGRDLNQTSNKIRNIARRSNTEIIEKELKSNRDPKNSLRNVERNKARNNERASASRLETSSSSRNTSAYYAGMEEYKWSGQTDDTSGPSQTGDSHGTSEIRPDELHGLGSQEVNRRNLERQAAREQTRAGLLNIKEEIGQSVSHSLDRYNTAVRPVRQQKIPIHEHRQLKNDMFTICEFAISDKGDDQSIFAAIRRLNDHDEKAMGFNNSNINHVVAFIKSNFKT